MTFPAAGQVFSVTIFPLWHLPSRCRQQLHGCRFIGTLAAFQEHRGFCNATWDELTHLRARANVAPRHPPVNSTTLAPRARAPPPGRQAALPPTPTSSLAEHRMEDASSQSSLTPASEAPPDATIPKLAPKYNPRSVPVATSLDEEASTSLGLAQEQLQVQSSVIKDSALAPSRSSSASLESLLAEHEDDPEGQYNRVEAIGVEDLELSVSPWVDSPSPVAQRPTEKRKSPPPKGGGHEKQATMETNGPPKKRQRLEMVQVTNSGRDPSGTAGSILVGPASINNPTQPNTKRPHNGSCLEQSPLD